MRNTRYEQMVTALSPTTDILPRLLPRSPLKIQRCGRELGGYLPKLISFCRKPYQSGLLTPFWVFADEVTG
jgi:hypothetical protein